MRAMRVLPILLLIAAAGVTLAVAHGAGKQKHPEKASVVSRSKPPDPLKVEANHPIPEEIKVEFCSGSGDDETDLFVAWAESEDARDAYETLQPAGRLAACKSLFNCVDLRLAAAREEGNGRFKVSRIFVMKNAEIYAWVQAAIQEGLWPTDEASAGPPSADSCKSDDGWVVEHTRLLQIHARKPLPN